MSDCTCNPERAPKPCPKRYQYSECILAAEVEQLRAALEERIEVATNLQMKLAAERERCARVADDKALESAYCEATAAIIAAAIRKGEAG